MQLRVFPLGYRENPTKPKAFFGVKCTEGNDKTLPKNKSKKINNYKNKTT